MEQSLNEISRQQHETWNKFSAGWKKWDVFTMNFLSPMGDAIIASLKPKETDLILDVATGTGEPGLSIARIVKKGKVIGTDLSDGMLEVAREHANSLGISNYETMACDVMEMPFPDAMFDAISCRFGFMFFPDMKLAAKEMARVLKPGGRISTTTWGEPGSNPWITAMMGPVNEMMQLAPPPAGAPGIFRCAAPGLMEDILKENGFTSITASNISGEQDFESPELYWNYITEVIAPVVAALGKATAEQKEKIHSMVSENLRKLNPSGGSKIKYSARIISAEK